MAKDVGCLFLGVLCGPTNEGNIMSVRGRMYWVTLTLSFP